MNECVNESIIKSITKSIKNDCLVVRIVSCRYFFSGFVVFLSRQFCYASHPPLNRIE